MHRKIPERLLRDFPISKKPRRVSPPQRRKKVQSFSPATCAAGKILLRLQVWNLCAGGAQIMRAADCSLFVKKYYFLTVSKRQPDSSGCRPFLFVPYQMPSTCCISRLMPAMPTQQQKPMMSGLPPVLTSLTMFVFRPTAHMLADTPALTQMVVITDASRK